MDNNLKNLKLQREAKFQEIQRRQIKDQLKQQDAQKNLER